MAVKKVCIAPAVICSYCGEKFAKHGMPINVTGKPACDRFGGPDKYVSVMDSCRTTVRHDPYKGRW